jgi:hypothetical protein
MSDLLDWSDDFLADWRASFRAVIAFSGVFLIRTSSILCLPEADFLSNQP